jgi:DNA-directed RNA polymerase subunit RPC12/RpoP
MYTKICRWCQKKIITKDHRQVFCGNVCSGKYYGEQRRNKLCYKYTCSKCSAEFVTKHKLRKNRPIRCEKCKRKVPRTKNIKSILDLSKRTVSKVIKRLKLSCFICGWDKAACDIHHIIPKKQGGSNKHNNLTYVCPNCHRLAHDGKITSFVTLQDKITLQDILSVYNCSPNKKLLGVTRG